MNRFVLIALILIAAGVLAFAIPRAFTADPAPLDPGPVVETDQKPGGVVLDVAAGTAIAAGIFLGLAGMTRKD